MKQRQTQSYAQNYSQAAFTRRKIEKTNTYIYFLMIFISYKYISLVAVDNQIKLSCTRLPQEERVITASLLNNS